MWRALMYRVNASVYQYNILLYVTEVPFYNIQVIYHCTMCDCTFNDDLAKELHLKGRRHRLNYKKQYDPTLKVVLVSISTN